MRKLLLFWSVSVLLSVGLHAQEAPDWEVYESPTYDYSIWYVEEFEEDVDLAEKAIDYAHEVGFEKYGVEDTHAHLRVKLYPAEGVFDLHKRIWAGTAWYSYYSRDPYAEIVFLTPSSPDKQGSITNLQLPHDDPATSAKTLVHESIHHIQTSVKQEPGIWKWPWLPHWFSEGMAEYEGLRYMIDEFKPNALDLLIDSLDYSGGPNNSISSATYRRHRFACCWGLSDVPEIQIGDAYNSGNLFLWHLAEMFGEEIHDDLIRYDAQSFSHALVEELAVRGTTLPDVFREFQDWIETNRPLRWDDATIERVPNRRSPNRRPTRTR